MHLSADVCQCLRMSADGIATCGCLREMSADKAKRKVCVGFQGVCGVCEERNLPHHGVGCLRLVCGPVAKMILFCSPMSAGFLKVIGFCWVLQHVITHRISCFGHVLDSIIIYHLGHACSTWFQSECRKTGRINPIHFMLTDQKSGGETLYRSCAVTSSIQWSCFTEILAPKKLVKTCLRPLCAPVIVPWVHLLQCRHSRLSKRWSASCVTGWSHWTVVVCMANRFTWRCQM